MQNNPSSEPIISKSYAISPIWFLPFIAAILGLWILFQNITHSNKEIKIHFNHVESIIVDKTKVRYKGVIIGTVKKVELDEVDGVNVFAEIESHAAFLLKESSQFWLVSPKATLTSISGLDTLFSGSYISLLPGEGEPETEFTAMAEQPINVPDNALLLNFKSDNAAANNVGTPIFFKKIQVGEIAALRLDSSGQFVNMQAFIESKYSSLVKQNSQFWNISGLNANISRAGIDFKLDNLTSLIAGGITFSSPENSAPAAKGQQYELFDNIEASQQGLSITIKMNNTNNLTNGAGILFKGHGIGRINTIRYDNSSQSFIAQATINPAFSELVTENSQFWLEKTSLSFSNIKNLGNIITGDYVGFSHSENYQQEKQKKTFTLRNHQIIDDQYLTITLIADDANGLTEGATVSYKGLTIGNINSLALTDDNKQIQAKLNINSQYQYLVNADSKFYALSGIDFKASLQGVEVNSKPLQNVIQGGIALFNKTQVNNPQVSNKKQKLKANQLFYLYPSKEMAILGKNIFSKPLTVALLSRDLPSVSVGSPVYYHKLKVGEVSQLQLHESGQMETSLDINAQFRHLVTDKTVFWDVSGFQVNAGISGVEINADSLLAIAAGGIALEISTAMTNNKINEQQYRLFDNYKQATLPPKQLTLTYDQAFDLKVGNKVKLKGLEIGKISELTLTDNNTVEATLDIDNLYFDKIAKQGSRFWIVRSDISLAGAKNLATLVSGVFINVSPGTGEVKTAFNGEHNEPLLAPDKAGLPIILIANNVGSANVGSPIYHRQIKIGEIIENRFNAQASGVEIVLNIYPEFSHLIRKNSVFWPASGFSIDVGLTGAALKATSLASIVKGGINMSTPDTTSLKAASEPYDKFTLRTSTDKDWAQWKLKIPKNN
ncbi:MlaD family protein [Psychromonas algicola]|uniref:MlaD family protein n=1 Tax=Psychromonas algicola TaxID=2555642 RepID=UPI00106863DE|nr:MlaD family protein [Psychromonas sp. RZ5]TEW45081.1 MCE family protein [Psychromonas sp. RZ5]